MNNTIYSLRKRLLAIFVLIAFIFILLITRLVIVQLVQGISLQAKALDQWTRDLPIKATRGLICDTNGNVLATNYSTYDVYVRANQVTDASAVSLTLSSILGIDLETVYKKVTDKSKSESLIKMQVQPELVEKIKETNLAGIVMSENSSRYYTYGDFATQVIGFTTIDNIGQAGIEAYANKYLTGVDGYALQESDVHGVQIDNTIQSYIPSIPGLNVNLTLDANVQRFTENAINQLVQDHKPKTATAIVMQPNTGEILAMCTKPSYDLNNIPRDNVSLLMEMTKNLSVVDVYEPGSTFKVLTTAAALEEKVTNVDDTFYDPGYRIIDGEKIKCWKLTGHGHQTLVEGLNNSCNSVFVDLALRLGKDKMYEYFAKYGFGQIYDVDFLGESAGILMDIDTAKNCDVARMGFGQAIAVTPLQQINAICSVVNGGNLMQPHFIKSITDSNGNIVQQFSPQILRRVVSEDTSATIRSMMESVIKQYTGIYSFIPGYRIGGKTGTSQKYENGAIVQKFVSSFVGTYPADNPEYVVLIVVDEPSSGNYYGSVVATPYAKLIFQDIISYEQDEPNENLSSDLVLVKPTIKMPNLFGMSITDAFSLLASLDLQFQVMGEGDFVIGQTPAEGTMVYKRAMIILST